MFARKTPVDVDSLRRVSETRRTTKVREVEVVGYFEQRRLEVYLTAIADVFFEQEPDVQPQNVSTSFVQGSLSEKWARLSKFPGNCEHCSILQITSQGFRVKSVHNK